MGKSHGPQNKAFIRWASPCNTISLNCEIKRFRQSNIATQREGTRNLKVCRKEQCKFYRSARSIEGNTIECICIRISPRHVFELKLVGLYQDYTSGLLFKGCSIILHYRLSSAYQPRSVTIIRIARCRCCCQSGSMTDTERRHIFTCVRWMPHLM